MEGIRGILHKNKEKWGVAAVALFLALLPWICAFVYCGFQGQSFSRIYLPASPWNDELFYYKLTESVIGYGYPQGYFGFNESHGMYLSFAAWSPVLLLFWVIWGFLFGWNLLSPMLCNLLLLSFAMLFFALLVKPDKRQALSAGIMYAAFLPVTRFALSCIPEVELFALFIVFLGLAVSCGRAYRGWMTGVMFGLVMLMTWMRPYLILLFLTPTALWIGQRGRKVLFPAGGLAVITVAVYGMVNHFFSAPYLTDLFYTEWITVYFEQGILAGLRYTAWKLCASLASVADMVRENLTVKSGLISAAGLYYFIFVLLLLWLLVRCAGRAVRREWKGFLLEGQMLLCMAGFFGADLLMYRLQEGGRHTLVYIVGCIFLAPFAGNMTRGNDAGRRNFKRVKRRGKNFAEEILLKEISPEKTSEKFTEEEKSSEGIQKSNTVFRTGGAMDFPTVPAAMTVVFLALFLWRGDIPYEFDVPFGDEEHRAELSTFGAELAENMMLTGGTPNYDNTVIWTAWDSVDGETKMVDFGAYYAVPEGFGINLCDGGYMDVNLEKLQSRYIGVIPGGEFEKRCQAAGGRAVGICERLVIYDMRPRM